MNFLRAIRMTAVFLLLATPADSRSAEIGWEALNQEAVDLYRAGDYDRALEVAKRRSKWREKPSDQTIPMWLRT